MTTSDPQSGAFAGEAAGFESTALPGVSTAAPWDPQALAGLANELFREGMQAFESLTGASLTGADLPGAAAAGPASFAGAALPVAPASYQEAASLPFGTSTNPTNLAGGAGLPVGAATNPVSSAATGAMPRGTERGLTPLPFESAAPAAKSAPSLPVLSSSESRWLDPVSAAGPSANASPLYFLEHAQQTFQHAHVTETQVPGFDLGASNLGARSAPVSYGRAPASYDAAARPFDAASLRRDFPILSEQVNGRPLVWLDNAATTQKPQAVIDRLAHFYARENSNVHRGAHTLAARSTDAYEAAREKVRRFLNAPSIQNIVFARGTTEAINLVAQSWGRRNLRAGDEIVITWLEHHSNIVPWQLLCSQTGAKLRVAPVDDSGQVLLDEYEKLFGPRTRLASFTHVSNALGTVTPVREMVEIAHRYGALALVDGAQSVSHMRVDVQALDCDFYVFSGHKVFGPTGIGALYGKSEVLDAMPAWQGGGNMIVDVTFERSIYQPAPMRFEAGTGNIADAVGLGAALDYLERVGLENVSRYEHELLQYGTARLLEIPKLRLIGTAKEKAGVMSFVIDGLSAEQVGAALAKEGIAVRAGHHCAQPALRRFGLEATVRPSLALYNTCDDIDALIHVLKQLQSSWLV